MRLKPPIVLVHGGAGSWKSIIRNSDDIKNKVTEVVSNAAKAGYEVLVSGGNAVDGAVEAVKVLEDSGILNAGLGSVLDIEGKVCMDAGVMDGSIYRAGAVACVTYPKNPVILARKVMELTDHVLLCCEGADKLARKLGLERHPGPTERAKKLWGEAREKLRKGEKPRDWWRKNWEIVKMLSLYDTVGAVALDDQGRLAAAVSTGGISFKLSGRIGDSCIPGAGFYANTQGAAVATGIGETIILSMLSLRAVDFLSLGMSADLAAKTAISMLEEKFGKNTAGLILLSKDGEVSTVMNTEGMPRAVMSKDLKKPLYSLWPNENQL